MPVHLLDYWNCQHLHLKVNKRSVNLLLVFVRRWHKDQIPSHQPRFESEGLNFILWATLFKYNYILSNEVSTEGTYTCQICTSHQW